MIGKAALGVLGIAGGLYLAVAAGLFVAQRALLYPAPRDATGAPPAGFAPVRLDTADGLALRAAYRAARDGRPTLMFFHGNGDSLAGAEVATRRIGAAGYGLLLVEYRGYAGNPGTPSETGLYADGRAALDWLAAKGIAPGQVVLVGNSLGSGVATQLATERPVAGLVLVSGYTSLVEVVAEHYRWLPVSWMLHDRFDNRGKIARVAAPVLVLHGEADTLIPAGQGAVLASAARQGALGLVPGVGHELAYGEQAQAMIVAWLGRIAARPSGLRGTAPASQIDHRASADQRR